MFHCPIFRGVCVSSKEFSQHVVAQGLRDITSLMAWVHQQMQQKDLITEDEFLIAVGLEAFMYIGHPQLYTSTKFTKLGQEMMKNIMVFRISLRMAKFGGGVQFCVPYVQAPG
jgi:hypothetical protein